MSVSIQFCKYDCPINLQYHIPVGRHTPPEFVCNRCDHRIPYTLEIIVLPVCTREFDVCPKCYPQWCVVKASWMRNEPENPDGMVGKIIWEFM